MSKQDRQGARTPADLERKYEFGQALSSIEESTKKQSDQISRQNSTMNDFIARSETEKASLEKSISNLEKSVSTLKQNVTSLQIRMTNADTKDKELSKSIYKVSQSVSRLESTVKSLATRLSTAELTLNDLVTRVTALEETEESGG